MLAIALAVVVQASNPFIVIGVSPTALLLFDEDSVRPQGEFRQYDQIMIPSSPEPFYGGRVRRATRYQYHVDCLTGSIQPVGFTLLDGSGSVLADHPGSDGDPMVRPPAGSAAELAASLACGRDADTAENDRFADIPTAIAAYYRELASARN